MDARNNDFDFDFTPIGQAIKKARTAKGMTREQLARILVQKFLNKWTIFLFCSILFSSNQKEH